MMLKSDDAKVLYGAARRMIGQGKHPNEIVFMLSMADVSEQEHERRTA